jgi:hypothetical protein
MRPPILMPAFLGLVFASGLSAQQPTLGQVVIDLNKIGYPQEACNWEGATQIEFLDSVQLLVGFPIHSSPCNAQSQGQPQKWRAAVIDASGKILHTLDFDSGQKVRAGPEGHILLLTEKEFSILDSDFTAVQRLSWPKEVDPAQIPHWAWSVATTIELAPSRQGFVIRGPHPKNGVAYFDGNPVKLDSEVDSCSLDSAVTDSGFACLEMSASAQLVVHRMKDDWHIESPLFQKREWFALPAFNRVLLLTNKFQLFQFTRAGNSEKVADLHWLAPILGYPRTSYALTSSVAHRILVSSWGFLIPWSDISGIGGYDRVVVLDYASGQIIFRKQYGLGAEVVISPDGHLLAVREKNRLSVMVLP